MAKKIAITTDSNSGIMPTEGNELGLFTISMPFIVDGQVYLENLELEPDVFYQKLNSDADISTSQPSQGEVTDFWDSVFAKGYDEIVHIPTSAALSAACDTAKNLAKDEKYAGKVFVVDNRRMTINLKESVYDAVKLRDQGLSSQEICDWLINNMQSSIYLAVDTMKFLKKGGRITPAAATIGTILKLKPILQIQGDKINKHSVAKGSVQAMKVLKECIAKDVAEKFADAVKEGKACISIAHARNLETASAIAEEFKVLYPNIPVRFIDEVSLSIACHTGPGVIGISISRCL